MHSRFQEAPTWSVEDLDLSCLKGHIELAKLYPNSRFGSILDLKALTGGNFNAARIGHIPGDNIY